MCGIAGIFGDPDPRLLDLMVRRLGHRGPDGRGVVQQGSIGLGNTRLSLIDAEHGAQPMVAAGGRLAVVYNGEIYNHRELRRALAGRGRSFAGRCDTEVAVRALEEWGAAALDRFDGMYALAAARRDERGDELFLARDPFGIKPLFYALTDGGRRLVFASEIKALLVDQRVPRRIDRSALADGAIFRYVLGHKTHFAAVSQVPPGAWLRIRRADDGRLAFEQGEHTPVRPIELPGDPEAAARLLLERLGESVDRQRVADHPVGVFLSGGVDSSLLATLAARAAAGGGGRGGGVHTFTVTDAPDHPDARSARAVAAALGVRHHEWAEPLPDLDRVLPVATAVHERPTSYSIVDAAAARIRRSSKAVLCGDGADELFGGYRFHADPLPWLRRAGETFNRLVATGELERDDGRDAKAALARLLTGDVAEARDRLWRFLLDDQLRDLHLLHWDRGGMAAGLEVRVPFLTPGLRDLALALPPAWRTDGSERKVLLRRAARMALPASVAAHVVDRPKLAAPSAYRECDRALEALARRTVPAETAARHPFALYLGGPVSQLQLDLFVWLFVARGGELPQGFRLTELYGAYGDELAGALAVAARRA